MLRRANNFAACETGHNLPLVAEADALDGRASVRRKWRRWARIARMPGQDRLDLPRWLLDPASQVYFLLNRCGGAQRALEVAEAHLRHAGTFRPTVELCLLDAQAALGRMTHARSYARMVAARWLRGGDGRHEAQAEHWVRLAAVIDELFGPRDEITVRVGRRAERPAPRALRDA
jgi:hypothetical protein